MQFWYQHLPASSIMKAERKRIGKVLPNLLGDSLLQIGGPSEFSLLSPIPHKIYLADRPTMLASGQLGIAADWSELPLYPGSVDVILLVHALELVPQPYQLLHDLYQALAAGGYLIVVGFNSFSWWGLMHLWKKKQHSVWHGRFYTIWQVKRWLRHLDFKIISASTFYFRPLLERSHWDAYLLWMEMFGQLCLPSCGGVFILHAQKQEMGITPVKMKVCKNSLVVASS